MSGRDLLPTRARSRTIRALGVTAGLAVAGAAVGAVLGASILGAMFAFGPWSVGDSDFMYAVVYGGGFGAAAGAVAAPAIAWGLLRHVPLGRAIAHTAAGTVLGAAIGAIADSPVIGGFVGFVAAALRLRFVARAGPKQPSPEIDDR